MDSIQEGEKVAHKKSRMIASHRPKKAVSEGYLGIEYEICDEDIS